MIPSRVVHVALMCRGALCFHQRVATVYTKKNYANYDGDMEYLSDLELGADEYIVALLGGPGDRNDCFHLMTNKGRKREWCLRENYGECAGVCEGAWATRGNMFIAMRPRSEGGGSESDAPIEVPIGGGEKVEITTGMEDQKDQGGAAWKEEHGPSTPDLD